MLSATSPSDALSVNAIAALDVRLRSLILSMAQYNRVNPSPAEQQVVHAVLAVEETDKVRGDADNMARGRERAERQRTQLS